MKTYILCVSIALTFGLNTVFAQQTTGNMQQLINEKSYVFEAEWVSPTNGLTRQLTPPYTLTITKDSVIADLPYFGKAYSAPLDLSNAGIQFTSTKFSYTQKAVKKGWSVVIKTNDNTNPTQLFFTIFDNGSATLQVNSVDKDAISFNGYVQARK